MMKAKLPVLLLTGFLGSGKTTWLNQLLKQTEFSNSLVIINEFGNVPVDHHLVENSSDTLLELSNGCLCCSVRGDLVDTLLDLDLEKFDRIIIEATGIADPLPIFQALAFHPNLTNILRPAAILCVFDAVRGTKLVEDNPEARNQLALADTIILTKTDLLDEASTCITQVNAINSHAGVITGFGNFDEKTLLAITKKEPTTGQQAHHTQDFYTNSIELDKPLALNELYGALHLIVNHYGNKLMRIKGIIRIEESPAPMVIQVSGQMVHNPEIAPEAELEKSVLVIITKDENPHYAADILKSFSGTPISDRPDKKALLENPLSILGVGS